MTTTDELAERPKAGLPRNTQIKQANATPAPIAAADRGPRSPHRRRALRDSATWLALPWAVASTGAFAEATPPPSPPAAKAPTAPVPAPAPAPAAASTTQSDITALLTAQAKAWSRGDLAGFCAPYADDAVFLSPSGLTKGRAEIEARYKKRYVEGGQQMGRLQLEVLDLRGDDQTAGVTLRWTLSWPARDKPPATGLSLVVLRRTPAGLRIVQDASM
jgi:uncharacterized protein (TIGR02246 family)